MLYSQLYRSILNVCREFSCSARPTQLVISLPLLVCIPSAYGAIVSQQPTDNKQSPNLTDTTLSSIQQTTDQQSNISNPGNIKTLQDNSTRSYKPLDTVDYSRENQFNADADDKANATTNTDIKNTITATAEQNGHNNLNSPNDSEVKNDNTSKKSSISSHPTSEAITATHLNANQTHSQVKLSDTQTTSLGKNGYSKNIPDDFDKDSVEQSLERLSEFYQPRQDNPQDRRTGMDIHSNTTNNLNNSHNNIVTHPQTRFANVDNSRSVTLSNNLPGDNVDSSQTPQDSHAVRPRNSNSINTNSSTKVIYADDSAPVVLPNYYYHESADPSSYRCEGVWVTPDNLGPDSQYTKAIQRAQQQDGLSLANGMPLYAQADYAYYDNAAYVELAGDVEVVQDGQLITSDKMSLDLNNGIAGARGSVLLADSTAGSHDSEDDLESLATNGVDKGPSLSGMIAVADSINYNTNNSTATAFDVAFASVPMQAHGYAKRMNKPDDTHYQLDKVMFSTCPPTDRKWQIEADQIDIDTDSGRGEAYDATFRLGKVPVFYLPYFNFPIDDRRSSGVLTPDMSVDSDNGVKVSVPYYLNLAPNYDATITTDVYTNRNPMLTGEFRYLTENFGEGNLTATYLPEDKEYNHEDRRAVFYEHQWQSESIPRLSAEAVYSYVSDPDYLSDFDSFGLVDNRLNLPRRAQVNYYNDYINTQLKVETFQSLDAKDVFGNEIQDKDKPYSRLPQLSIKYLLPELEHQAFDDVVITGTHDSAYFKKSINDGSEAEKSGIRVFNEISASRPFEKTWGYITPKVSLQHLYAAYDEESRIDNDVSKDDNDRSAFVPEISVDSGLNFYRPGSPFKWFDDKLGGYQLLSPRLKYTYAPYEDQSDIPNFNTRIASSDYDQLFSDSWFLGYDRLSDNNNIAVGLNYRYIDAMGITRFDGSIGDQFYLDKPKVTLEDDTKALLDDRSSGIAWKSSVQPYRNIWFDFDGALNADNDIKYISSQFRYRPTPRSLVNFGIVERKEDTFSNQSPLSAIIASTIFPLNDNWRVLAQGQYDNNNHKFIDSTVGFDYEDCCYGFSIYARSYYNDLNLDDDPKRAVMAEFRINGFGDRSSRLSRHLDRKILGLEPVDEIWRR